MNLYTMQKVNIRNDNVIDVRSEYIKTSYSFQLSYNAVRFVETAGDQAGVFTIEGKGAPKILLLYNSVTGELFIPDSYSEEERLQIRKRFIQFLLNKTESKYEFLEME